MELLVTHIKRQLDSRSLRFRNMLAKMGEDDDTPITAISPARYEEQGVYLLDQTPQLMVSWVEFVYES